MARKILHLDLDAFFCAVEEQHNPDLVGKPFAVGGRMEERGVVASCSYPARQYGVRSAMPMAQAVRLCPELRIVPSRHKLYGEISRKVMAVLADAAPLIEQISIDEAFLDVTGRRETGQELAIMLQKRINDELGLPCSLGIASNKLVAKIANNIGKAEVKSSSPPNAIKAVPVGKEAEFLAPLPVRELWGVGPKTAEKLNQYAIRTIGDIAQASHREMLRLFGKHGADLVTRARGIDDRPVETEHEAKSISRETTFAEDVSDQDVLERTLLRLTQSVTRRLRRAQLSGNTVKLKLRWSDFSTITRQSTLAVPTDNTQEVYQASLQLFHSEWRAGRYVRLIGVGVSGFKHTARQLGLWDEGTTEQEEKVDETLDRLKDRFGEGIVKRASDLWLDSLSREADEDEG